VTTLGDPFPRFFAASVALHLLLLISWPTPQFSRPSETPIQVSLLPAPNDTPAPDKPTAAPKAAPARPSKSQAIIAQKNSPILQERPIGPKESNSQREMRREEPPPRKPVEDQFAIAERQLPTLKELLPPVNWSTSGQRSNRNDGPVSLNTRDPQYITYFGSIKRAIEVVWQYPEMALRYGLQGKLLMEFSILENGELARARIVRSSGSNLLDEEALRAVRSAAPFSPIPPWIAKEQLDILASFEYYDNRLNYRYMP
jgi:protein TonB